jgi:glycine/D-amino acid oxidase-like deaminating enzyme
VFHRSDDLYKRVAEGFDGLNAALRPIFGGTVYEWQDQRIGDLGLRADHLAFTALEGAVDSGRLMRALHARVAGAGTLIRHGCAVRDWGTEADGTWLELDSGERIAAERMVIATNGYAAELLPEADVRPARGQVLLTHPIPGLALNGTFHATEGFHYFRHLGDRVLLGGGRHLDVAGETTTADGITDLIQADLERLLRDMILPGRSWSVEMRWSGVMGFRAHGKEPLVKRMAPGVVVAAGLSGMGVAIGHRVAERAAELLET